MWARNQMRTATTLLAIKRNMKHLSHYLSNVLTQKTVSATNTRSFSTENSDPKTRSRILRPEPCHGHTYICTPFRRNIKFIMGSYELEKIRISLWDNFCHFLPLIHRPLSETRMEVVIKRFCFLVVYILLLASFIVSQCKRQSTHQFQGQNTEFNRRNPIYTVCVDCKFVYDDIVYMWLVGEYEFTKLLEII